jgi:dihydroflavonol-4-reductase
MGSPRKVVAVTGANGFLASHIIEELLKRGYRVRGTVRSVKDQSKVAHLSNLKGASKRLELFEADLTDRDAFLEAFEGCDYVIHSASPFTFKKNDPQVRLLFALLSLSKFVTHTLDFHREIWWIRLFRVR